MEKVLFATDELTGLILSLIHILSLFQVCPWYLRDVRFQALIPWCSPYVFPHRVFFVKYLGNIVALRVFLVKWRMFSHKLWCTSFRKHFSTNHESLSQPIMKIEDWPPLLFLLPALFYNSYWPVSYTHLDRQPMASSGSNPFSRNKTLIAGGIICGICLCLASNFQQFGIQYTSVGKAGSHASAAVFTQ